MPEDKERIGSWIGSSTSMALTLIFPCKLLLLSPPSSLSDKPKEGDKNKNGRNLSILSSLQNPNPRIVESTFSCKSMNSLLSH
ncbi:hypothetical protein RJT34_12565 [Clitoria ternatea]|uniref:Uncharacterized protein n=1 Tax=Clitoria ternatea TaxID=43366 RepID=A0AAN9JPN5_CLITE